MPFVAAIYVFDSSARQDMSAVRVYTFLDQDETHIV